MRWLNITEQLGQSGDVLYMSGIIALTYLEHGLYEEMSTLFT